MPYMRRRYKRRRSVRRSRGFRSRRSFGRRFRRFRRTYRRRRNALSKMYAGFRMPARVFQKLIFTASYPMASTGGLVFDQWVGNDIWNIDGTNTANPYDRFAPSYQRWVVFGSSASLRVVNHSTTSGSVPLTVVLIPTSYTSGQLSASIDQLSEQMYAKRRDIQANTGGPSVCTIKSYMSTSKIGEVPARSVAQDLQYWGTGGTSTNASPQVRWRWQFYLDAMNQNTNTFACNYRIKIVYYAMFFQRQTVFGA